MSSNSGVDRSATSTQKALAEGLECFASLFQCMEYWVNARIKTENIRASTPISLLGIDRRIAYANKKYHSGLICGGVLRGFAGM